MAHKHEWTWRLAELDEEYDFDLELFCQVDDCDAVMPWEEMLRAVQAREELTAEDARVVWRGLRWPKILAAINKQTK